VIQCDVTESVIPSGRYRGVTVLRVMRDEKKGVRVQKVFVPVNKRSFPFVSMASMRVSRSVLPCGEMVRVPFRHNTTVDPGDEYMEV
jgi:hypothetical protein